MDIKAILGDQYKDGMTVEELTAALADIDVLTKAEVDEKYVSKDVSNRLSSEAAKRKRETAAANDEIASLKETVKALQRASTIADSKAKLTAMGYADTDAVKAAEAMADGDMTSLMAIMAAHNAAAAKQAKSDTVHSMSAPPSGGADKPVDYSKAITDAQDAGDYALMAHYMRVQQEAQAASAGQSK